MIRVVLAEDEPLLRSGLRLLLERDGQISVVAEVGDGAAALAAVRRHRPHVLLVDLRMPVLGGVGTIRALRQDPELKDTPALVLTTFDSEEDIVEALRVGANGYLLKDLQPEELRRAIRSIASGTPVMSPSVLATVLRTVAQSRPARTEILDRFTARERDVLAAVARGLSNNEIAVELHLSSATVRTYVSRMLTSSGLRDRSQLVILAYESGLAPGGRDIGPDQRDR